LALHALAIFSCNWSQAAEDVAEAVSGAAFLNSNVGGVGSGGWGISAWGINGRNQGQTTSTSEFS